MRSTILSISACQGARACGHPKSKREKGTKAGDGKGKAFSGSSRAPVPYSSLMLNMVLRIVKSVMPATSRRKYKTPAIKYNYFGKKNKGKRTHKV